ncbi:hypothetical protein KFK09_025676 [Dendrobium nobile]|uniref:Uncharacterized protein n=1 Tax=Dendrobium nobile TaxID=94219 RepID=A0A8T3A4L4_DENNO|nr:hypothetical protein KFK09_025676 [Dendrobium nobile]
MSSNSNEKMKGTTAQMKLDRRRFDRLEPREDEKDEEDKKVHSREEDGEARRMAFIFS